MTKLSKARLRISGRVQGVFYRQTTRDNARSLGLSGWVQNLEDGAVAVEVLGPRERVEELIRWCWSGPPAAKVTAVEVEWQELDVDQAAPSGRFEIRY